MTVTGCPFRLRPCPLNNPLDEVDADVHPYPLLEDMADVPATHRAEGPPRARPDRRPPGGPGGRRGPCSGCTPPIRA